MTVRVANDICLCIVDDPEHDQRFRGMYVLHPNSVRTDVVYPFALSEGMKISKTVITGKDLK